MNWKEGARLRKTRDSTRLIDHVHREDEETPDNASRNSGLEEILTQTVEP